MNTSVLWNRICITVYLNSKDWYTDLYYIKRTMILQRMCAVVCRTWILVKFGGYTYNIIRCENDFNSPQIADGWYQHDGCEQGRIRTAGQPPQLSPLPWPHSVNKINDGDLPSLWTTFPTTAAGVHVCYIDVGFSAASWSATISAASNSKKYFIVMMSHYSLYCVTAYRILSAWRATYCDVITWLLSVARLRTVVYTLLPVERNFNSFRWRCPKSRVKSLTS